MEDSMDPQNPVDFELQISCVKHPGQGPTLSLGAKLDNLLRDTPKHLSAVCKVLNLSCGLLAQRLLSDKHVQ